MNVLNLNYANMVKEAQEELNKIWVPNIGDLVINSDGMVGVLTNRDKQEIKVSADTPTQEMYIGVSLVHNGKLWTDLDPIWMPRLSQLVELVFNKDPQSYLSRFNRWMFSEDFSEDANYTYKFTDIEELAFAYYMDKAHNKRWNFEEKKWEARI